MQVSGQVFGPGNIRYAYSLNRWSGGLQGRCGHLGGSPFPAVQPAASRFHEYNSLRLSEFQLPFGIKIAYRTAASCATKDLSELCLFSSEIPSFSRHGIRHSSLFRFHILIPSFKRFASVSASIWFIVQNLFGYLAICHSIESCILFCTDCIFSAFLISSV
jgi:hypothetical protein